MQFEAKNRYLAIECNDDGLFHRKEIIRKKYIAKIYVSQPYEEELIIETRISDKTLFMKIKNKREKVIEFYNKFKEIVECNSFIMIAKIYHIVLSK